jgi:hypothetical protein
MDLFDIEEMKKDIETSGNPIGTKTLEALMRTVDKVQWPRHYKLLRSVAIVAVWKGLFSQIYRPIFYDFLNELRSSVTEEELSRYMRDPSDWKINKGAAILNRRAADAEKRDKNS